MKKSILFLALTLLFTFNCYSQIVFKSGYLINENNQKIECLIETTDSKNTPANLRYKLSNDQAVINAESKNIKEFGIIGQNKFINSVVKTDRSSKNSQDVRTDKNPTFTEEKIFIQVLMEGKASLFLFDDKTGSRFFYKIDDSEIKQLIYKTSVANDDRVVKNNYFREQLYLDLKCDAIQQREYENLNYTKNELVRFFTKYNKCNNSNFEILEVKEKKDLFNLTARPRYNISNLSVSSSLPEGTNFDFDNKSSFSLGIEAEYFLPFKKDRWSLILEPNYQYYKADQTIQTSKIFGGFLIAKVDYKSIELPIGVRNYFFINDRFKLFVNASIIMDISSGSSINMTRDDGSEVVNLDIKSGVNFGFGLGCKFKDKFSLELRYQTPREILSNSLAWNSSFKTTSILLGYSIF